MRAIAAMSFMVALAVLARSLLTEFVGGCSAGNGGRANVEFVIGICAEQLNVAPDIAVVIDNVVTSAEAGEQVVGNRGRFSDRQRIVSFAAVKIQRPANAAGDRGGIGAATKIQTDVFPNGGKIGE